MPRFPFADRARFFLERQFIKGAGHQLLFVAAAIGLVSALGGALLLFTEEDGFPDSIWWAFLRLTDPGYLGDDEGTWRRTVSTWLTVSGYVLFMGTLVAILTRWLIDMMHRLELGLTPVSLRNHVVVLGWNSRSVPLLQELLGSGERLSRFLERHNTRGLKLVVLAEDVSAQRMHEFRQQSHLGRAAERIIFRSGTALQPEALQRAACVHASAVIIPADTHNQPTPISSDMETIKALLSLSAEARALQSKPPFVVAELSDSRRIPAARRAYAGNLEVLAGDRSISRLLAQNLMHPGMTELYTELLSAPDGNEFFIHPAGEYEADTMAEAARKCPHAILCGLLREYDGQWRTVLNAPSDTHIEPGDLLVFLSSGFDNSLPVRSRKEYLDACNRPERIIPINNENPTRMKVLLLGWNRRVPALIRELGTYQGCHFDVCIVSSLAAQGRRREIEAYGTPPVNVHCEQIEADFLQESELQHLKPERFDNVIFSSSDRLGSREEADARALLGSLLLEDVLDTQASRPQLLLELSDPSNELLLAGGNHETLISSRILSHMLAQIALRRELLAVYDELFTVGGAEIVFHDPGLYGLSSDSDFGSFEQQAAAAGETALGVIRQQPVPGGGRLQLNPPRSRTLDLQAGDRLVVLITLDPADQAKPDTPTPM